MLHFYLLHSKSMNLGLSHVHTHTYTYIASENNWEADWITEMSPEVIILMNSRVDCKLASIFLSSSYQELASISALFDFGLGV